MDKELEKIYIPMTETFFYILISLIEPRHGYGIIKYISTLTNNRIILGSGTVYTTLSKMLADNIIVVFKNEKRKILYRITSAGKKLLKKEIQRIKMLYKNIIELKELENE